MSPKNLSLSELRNLTDPTFVAYVQEPNGRGTTSLILSCLLTLILCVWSALHLNVPEPGQTVRQRVLMNLRWILTGIYPPELVVFTAWRQWSSARILKDSIEQHQTAENLEKEPTSAMCGYSWSMAHSFFACAGGFAYEVDRDMATDLPELPKRSAHQTRIPITARGVDILAKCGLLPQVSKEEIEDKSKANALAKTAVIIQALWMLLQVVGRLIASMPVTLLEINTVAHV